MKRRSTPLKPLPAFGYYALAGTIGLYGGVASYQPKCVELLMQLDDSPMASELREHMARTTAPQRQHHGESSDTSAAAGSGTAPARPAPGAYAQTRGAPSRPGYSSQSQYQRQQQHQEQEQADGFDAHAEPAAPPAFGELGGDDSDAPDAFGSGRPQQQGRSLFDEDDSESRKTQPRASYADLRTRNRHRVDAPSEQGARSAGSPPAGPGYDRRRAEAAYEERPTDQGLIDPQPKPTHPSDAMRHTQRYTKYGDPIEE